MLIFDDFFPTPEDETPLSAKDVSSDEEYSGYKSIEEGTFIDPVDAILSGGLVFGGLAVVGFFTRGSLPMGQFIGLSLIISVVCGLWTGLTSPILSLTKTYGGQEIYNIIIICIGIVAMLSFLEVLTGKGDEY